MAQVLSDEVIGLLNEEFSEQAPEKVIAYFLERFRGRIALSSSLGLEDQVLTDMICNIDKTTRIFTLDTGRLFPETYSLIARTNEHYDIKMEVLFPDRESVELLVKECGINCFYRSVEDRKRCCKVRKIDSIKRAFTNLDVWICGLRRSQSLTRTKEQLVEFDSVNGLVKLNPLVAWTEEDLKEYIKAHGVPYNKMHDKGYPSIGCQPCTRAVESDEDVRAGRWWWEDPTNRECGLHKRI